MSIHSSRGCLWEPSQIQGFFYAVNLDTLYHKSGGSDGLKTVWRKPLNMNVLMV